MKKVAIRDAYGEALKKLGQRNEKIIALEADVGASTKSAVFGNEFPDRYFNVGISEMNMTAMAAGFALEGFVPFVNTFASFLTTRGADPIQSLIAYDRLNVKLAGTYCGLSDSYDGASHHSITDMAFVRAIPGVAVVSVSDGVETEKAVFALAEYEGPVYLRLSRAPAPVIYDENLKFEIGKGIVLKEGTDVTIIATGTVLHQALEAAKLLREEGIEAAVIDMHTVKPVDRELITAFARKTGAIVTVEEHSIHGGLGSAVAEVLVQEYPAPLEMIGAEEFAESGDYGQLLEKYGYSSQAIGAACRKVMARK